MSEAPIDHLCQIITQLSETARPPCSAQELAAARYVQRELAALDAEDIQEQPFYSIGGPGERLGAAGVLAGAGLLIGASEARWRRVLGALVVLGAALSTREILKGQAPPWELLWPQRRSQNILGRIPAGEEARSRVVLLAHLDSDRQRLTAHEKVRDAAPYLYAGLPNAALLGAVLTLLNAPLWLRHLLAYALFGSAGLNIANDKGKPTPGANDNASGVAMLLALGTALAENPLPQTEVVLAFTGCGTVAGRGAQEVADQYGQQWRNALWLAVDSIGAGEVGWVSSHGLSRNVRYKPDEAVHDLLTRVASANPHLGVMGRPMTTLDDIAPLRARNLKAGALISYQRASGFPAGSGQPDDTPDQIDPTTLGRAWEFLWAVLREVDTQGFSG